MAFNSFTAGLPVVGPQAGEPALNATHRRGVLRNVSLEAGPQICVGVPNRLFDCYFISIVQALIHHPRAAQFFRRRHIGPRSRADGNVPLIQHQTAFRCGHCQLYELLVRYWTRDLTQSERATQVASRFRKLQDRFNEYVSIMREEPFDADAQHDASEAFGLLVEWLGQSHDCQSGAPSKQAVSALFETQIQPYTICTQCGTRADQPATLQTVVPLHFPTGDTKSYTLQSLIKDSLEGELEKRCDTCSAQKDVVCKRHGQIIHFPELLCFSLVVYEYDPFTGDTKMSKKKAAIPATLDLSSYLSPLPNATVAAKTVEYELSAVVRHLGNGTSINEGHYVTHIKASDGTWKLCDDDNINNSGFRGSVNFGAKSVPFMLFYARKYPAETRTADVREAEVEYELPSWLRDAQQQPAPTEEPLDTENVQDGAAVNAAEGNAAAKDTVAQEKAAQEVAAAAAAAKEAAEKEKAASLTESKKRRITTIADILGRGKRRVHFGKASYKPNSNLDVDESDSDSDSDSEIEKNVPKSAAKIRKILGKKESDPNYQPVPDEEAEDAVDEPEAAAVLPELEEIAEPVAAPASEEQPAVDYTELTVVNIKEELSKRGIAFASKARKADLIQLLVDNDAAPGTAPAKDEATIPAVPLSSAVQRALGYTKLTVVNIKKELNKRHVPFTPRARKADLVQLLVDNDAGNTVATDDTAAAKPKTRAQGNKSAYASLKVPDLKAELTKRGIKWKVTTKKVGLIRLLVIADKKVTARGVKKAATTKAKAAETSAAEEEAMEPAGEAQPEDSAAPALKKASSKKRAAESETESGTELRRSKRSRPSKQA